MAIVIKRDVNLIKYLPEFLQRYEEMQQITETENPEFRFVLESVTKVIANAFIESADAEGLSVFEKYLGLIPKGSVEERRTKVYYGWNKQTVYTERAIRALLTELLGKDGFTFQVIYYKYQVRFEINANNSKVDRNFVKEEVKNIIPANLGLENGMFWVTGISFEPMLNIYGFCYTLCGQKLCGTIPWASSNGIRINVGLAYQLDNNIMRRAALYPSDRALLNKQTLNPHHTVDMEIVINDKEPWLHTDRDYDVLESDQYR